MKKALSAFWLVLFSLSPGSAKEGPLFSILFSSDIEPYQQASQGFRELLAEHGLSARFAPYDLKNESPESVDARLRQSQSTLVVALGTPALKFAREKIQDVPVVFCMVLNPKRLQAPNITGVSMDIPLSVKLRIVKSVLPNARRAGVLYSRNSNALLAEMVAGASAFGLEVLEKEVGSDKELPAALKEMSWQIDVFLMLPDSGIYFPKSTEYLLLESLRNKFPVIGLSSVYTKAGALLSFDGHYKDMGRQAGEMAVRLLRGEQPEALPIAPPRTIHWSLNRLTAERLDLKIPEGVAREATEIFGQ